MSPQILGELVIYMIVLLFAVSAHEAAHAWMSYKFGDDTAYLLGRITLNPARHIDPVGTLLFPIIGFVLSMQGGTLGRIPFIGWGKPTPVNPLRWRDKNKANVMVSLAGIFANLITAIAVLIAIKICQYTGLFNAAINPVEEPLRLLLINGLLVNTSLALFNLLPFPPLDGSKVVETFLPDGLRPVFAIFEQYGFLILWMLMYMGFFNAIFSPVSSLLVFLLRL